MAGGGGVIRGQEGEWIAGFARPLGRTNSCMAEFWACEMGCCWLRSWALTTLL